MSEKDESKRVVDWERVEEAYRAGLLSVREIGAAQGVSHVAIAKRAKKEGWERDLSAKIKVKADALVTKAMVTNLVTKEQLVTDRAIVEAGAQAIANVRMSHRSDIRRSKNLALALLAELEAQTSDVPALAQLGELLASPDDKGVDKLNDLYQKIINLPSRVDSMKKLAETLKNLIVLEREAYGLDAKAAGVDVEEDSKEITIKFVRPQ